MWDALEAGVLPALQEVVVAEIDTGYVADSGGNPHADLEGNLLVSDGYDFIRDLRVSADADGIDSDASDQGDGTAICGSAAQDHTWRGTAVAGIIAAESHNGTLVAGMSWPWPHAGRRQSTSCRCAVLGVRGGSSYDIAQGIRYVAGLENDSGTSPSAPAKVLNMSFGGPGAGAVIEKALKEAVAAGAIPVAASGNFDTAVFAPANSRYAIAVGAAVAAGSRATFSNFGASLDLVAAGDDVLVLTAAQSCPAVCSWVGMAEPQDGTSFATPHVAAALALVAAIDARPDV